MPQAASVWQREMVEQLTCSLGKLTLFLKQREKFSRSYFDLGAQAICVSQRPDHSPDAEIYRIPGSLVVLWARQILRTSRLTRMSDPIITTDFSLTLCHYSVLYLEKCSINSGNAPASTLSVRLWLGNVVQCFTVSCTELQPTTTNLPIKIIRVSVKSADSDHKWRTNRLFYCFLRKTKSAAL